jgi:hypothetical protein
VNGISNGNTAVGQICVEGSSPCAPPSGPVAGGVDYLAPATIPTPNPVTLTATSQADPTRSGTALATILPPLPAGISMAPPYAFIAPGSTQQFTTAVGGISNTAVTWSLASAVPGQGCGGDACGTIDNNGLYTAPANAPSPNAIAVTATSQADPTESATATVAVTSGPAIEQLLPSSVIAGAANGFTLAVRGQGFAAGSGGAASVIFLGSNPRATSCASATQCTITLQPADISASGTVTVQVQNPGSPGPLSNPVPFVVVSPGAGEDAIPLTTVQPTTAGRDIVVAEPTTAGTTGAQINVDFIGFVTAGNSCGAQGSPLFVTRPASGTTAVSLCIHGNGLDPSFTYAFSGPATNDITVSATSLAGLFPNLIQLNVTLSSTTQPGPRTLFITTPNNDTAAGEMKRTHMLAILLLLSLITEAARGTTFARMSLEELAAAAPLVVRVRCLENTAAWKGGEIWTITSFAVLEVWKGSAPAQIAVRLIGGHVGHLISSVAGVPRFQPGEEAVLFLVPTRDGDFTVSGWMQGTFRIHRDPRTGIECVTQDTAGMAVFDPRTRQFATSGIRDVSLERLRERVAAETNTDRRKQ